MQKAKSRKVKINYPRYDRFSGDDDDKTREFLAAVNSATGCSAKLVLLDEEHSFYDVMITISDEEAEKRFEAVLAPLVERELAERERAMTDDVEIGHRPLFVLEPGFLFYSDGPMKATLEKINGQLEALNARQLRDLVLKRVEAARSAPPY
jgi:hypothetical protein